MLEVEHLAWGAFHLAATGRADKAFHEPPGAPASLPAGLPRRPRPAGMPALPVDQFRAPMRVEMVVEKSREPPGRSERRVPVGFG
jgi:hypothetical protein